MGNHKKRTQIAQQMKQKGLGRLYKGSKRKAWGFLRGRTLNDTLRLVSLNPGDLVNDCDMFNHKVKEIIPERWTHKSWTGKKAKGWVYMPCQLLFEDGRRSCGCGAPEAPYTPQKIADSLRECYEYNELEFNDSFKDVFNHEIMRRIKEGKMLTDEQGIILPELDILRQP